MLKYFSISCGVFTLLSKNSIKNIINRPIITPITPAINTLFELFDTIGYPPNDGSNTSTPLALMVLFTSSVNTPGIVFAIAFALSGSESVTDKFYIFVSFTWDTLIIPANCCGVISRFNFSITGWSTDLDFIISP